MKEALCNLISDAEGIDFEAEAEMMADALWPVIERWAFMVRGKS